MFCISSDENLPASKQFLKFRDISKVDQIRDFFLRDRKVLKISWSYEKNPS